MRIDVGIPDFRALAEGIEGEIAQAATEAMRETMPLARQELREQVTSAGLGVRLANTWRGESYPRSQRSITPAGYIWSNAPQIVDAFSRGAVIRPLGGKRYLWIPTEKVPRAGGRRGSTKRMTADQVEIAFNQDLIIRRGQNGRMLAFVNAVTAKSGRGHRQSTKARQAQGRKSKLVLMFVLVPTVRLPKLLELNAVADGWASRFETAFNRRLGAS